jgi:hypothetical protein
MYKVYLTYFDMRGRYYTQGDYYTKYESVYDICDEVKMMLDYRGLPGLAQGHSKYIVMASVPEHPCNCPTLIFPE